jgi:hypothetical protein
MHLADPASASGQLGELVALGLDARSKLWAGERLLAPQCSSLAVHPSFVLITTVGHPQHSLHLLDRHRSLDCFTERDLTQLAQYGTAGIHGAPVAIAMNDVYAFSEYMSLSLLSA